MRRWPCEYGQLEPCCVLSEDVDWHESVRRELAQLRQAIVTAFRERFERAVQDGDLPAGTDCATLARYTATVLNGLAVQAASGAIEEELRLVSALAMQAWPS